MNKKEIIEEIQNFIKNNQNLDMDSWAWYNLPDSDNFSYIILIDWQEGYDKGEHKTFIKNGYGLNVSIRINNGQYFKCDNPYPIANKYGDIIDGCTLSDEDIKDNFKSMSEFMYKQYTSAIESEEFSLEML